jgi:hypothetical protein
MLSKSMTFETIIALAVIALLVLVIGYLVLRKREPAAVKQDAPMRHRGEIDVVAAWPPQATRLLTGVERAAHETLVKALPECIVFAQVPLARFIKVPRRYSYAEWMNRVGHLCPDLVICDRSTLVIGVVLVKPVRESERGEQRRVVMTQVLKAASVRVFLWREEALPNPEAARAQLTQKLPDVDIRPHGAEEGALQTTRRAGPDTIPVADVVAELSDVNIHREPPSSTWFDDLDSGRVPLEGARDRPSS